MTDMSSLPPKHGNQEHAPWPIPEWPSLCKVKRHHVCLQTCLWSMLLLWLSLLEWNSFLQCTRETAWKVRKTPKERAANLGPSITQVNNRGHSTAQADNGGHSTAQVNNGDYNITQANDRGYRIARVNNVHREISSSPCRTQLIQCTKQVPPP